MDEYVATIIPIKMAKEKPLITSPPKMKRIAITKITVSDVTIVRLNVRLIARLTVSAIASFFRRGMPKYSRQRSNTTPVSFTEYAMTVRRAATKCWSISNENGTMPSNKEKRMRITNASCIVGIAAARLYCHLWKRKRIYAAITNTEKIPAYMALDLMSLAIVGPTFCELN